MMHKGLEMHMLLHNRTGGLSGLRACEGEGED